MPTTIAALQGREVSLRYNYNPDAAKPLKKMRYNLGKRLYYQVIQPRRSAEVMPTFQWVQNTHLTTIGTIPHPAYDVVMQTLRQYTTWDIATAREEHRMMEYRRAIHKHTNKRWATSLTPQPNLAALTTFLNEEE